MNSLPLHLKKYIVEQKYDRYTAQDHAVWRYILRQLKCFLTKNAHESYLDGLIKTGIDVEKIPSIESISQHLEKFGWRALPVSGFIPPAAFMELQSLSILPIAADIRSLAHLQYTPAPDIVHEAAGHAPFIANNEYSDYLKQYAQVAKKAIISKEDFDVYKCIRELSDLKEHPKSTVEQIESANLRLTNATNSMTFVSEAAELSRMNWWTAEYGLIGNMTDPKIFGAGLLSSVGESRWCLSDRVVKHELSLNCIKQSYDITEPQPQLYVARDFQHLSDVLSELAKTMAYQVGGTEGLSKALQARSVNTVQFENGIQISGILKNFKKLNAPFYLQFEGPTQLSFNYKEIAGHGVSYHNLGYGTPVGKITNCDVKSLHVGKKIELIYDSGVKIYGVLKLKNQVSSEALILTIDDATCMHENEILFRPEWGLFDVVIAEQVTSVFGGPADRVSYGDTEDFTVSKIENPTYSKAQHALFKLFQEVRDLRNSKVPTSEVLAGFFETAKTSAAEEWLIYVELLEMSISYGFSSLSVQIESYLNQLGKSNPQISTVVSDGIYLARERY